MHADHVLRTVGERGDLVDVERRGVRGQDGALLGDAVEFLEDLFLDADFFEHRFDDEVGVLQVVVAQRGAQKRHALLVLVLLELALLDLGFVVLLDGGNAAVERLLLHLEDLDGDARVQEVHRDAAAHGAGADHAHGLDVALGRVFGHVGNLARGALGHEQVAQGQRFGREHQRGEQASFFGHAVVELHLGRGLHGVDALQRRGVVLRHAADHVLGELEVGIALRVLARQVAHQRQLAALGSDRLGELDGFVEHRFGRGGQLVEQLLARQAGEQFALHRLAADDHVQGGFHADHARQALRATGARQQAELDFRQCHAGAGSGHAVVAAERQLEAAAHAHGVDGCDDGLGRGFEREDHAQQVGLLQRLGRAEFLDVRTARERLAGAGDDDGLDGAVGIGLGQAVGDADACREAETVDRRVGQGDHGDIAEHFVFSRHAAFLGV
ncbi:hypothetical protein D9M72_444110 [compost metagenome]